MLLLLEAIGNTNTEPNRMCHSIRSSSRNLVSTITDWMEGGSSSERRGKSQMDQTGGQEEHVLEAEVTGMRRPTDTHTSHVVIKLVAAILSYPPS